MFSVLLLFFVYVSMSYYSTSISFTDFLVVVVVVIVRGAQLL